MLAHFPFKVLEESCLTTGIPQIFNLNRVKI